MSDPVAAFLAVPAIAVVGVSRTRGFGTTALHALRAKGWRCFPVNAAADDVHGERCFRSLAALPERVGAALVVVPPTSSAWVLEECARLGIRNVWLQPGAESPDALRVARERGLSVVHGECVLMHAKPRGIHRLHRWVRDLRAR
jgi:predicted CoA-binding protein